METFRVKIDDVHQKAINDISFNGKCYSVGHVAGLENSADLGSRGVLATDLKNDRLWWDGSKLLIG